MTSLRNTSPDFELTQFVWISKEVISNPMNGNHQSGLRPPKPMLRFSPLQPIRRWLDGIEIRHPEMAHRICQLVPARCPFERTIQIFGHTLLHIPPLCKLNPFYEQIVGLRFRALCYLADECGEDITCYC